MTQAYPRVCLKIEKLIDDNKFDRGKVGSTGDFKDRYRWYDRELRRFFQYNPIGITSNAIPIRPDRMYILYKTNARNSAKNMERWISQEYARYLENEISGGGGNLSGPPYFVYLVIQDQKWVI